jgi:ATP-dependent Lon protease
MPEIQFPDPSVPGPTGAAEIGSTVPSATEDSDSVLAAITAAGLPVVPLIDAVAFPRITFPLQIGRPFSVAAIEHAEQGDGLVFLVAQKGRSRRKMSAKDLYRVGTVARVVRKYRMPEGGFSVLMEGLYRAEIVDTDLAGDAVIASVAEVGRRMEETVELEALRRAVAAQVQEFAEKGNGLPAEIVSLARRISDPDWLVDLVAAHAAMELETQQDILETLDTYERLYKASLYLSEQLHVLGVRERIQAKIQDGIEKVQRDFYLREQLRTIQRELGIANPQTEDVDELRERIAESDMPEEVNEKASKEVDRLEATAPASPEVAVIRNYVDWLLDLPWGARRSRAVSIARARKALDANHYGLEKVKERILEYLAVQSLSSTLRSPVLCLSGPPGVGKTSLGRSIAKALGREFVRISLGGVRDEAEIRGHRRTYVGAMPGRIIQGMRQAGTTNPVFVLDEVDKIGRDFRGDPSSALLEVLDLEHNHSFSDHYIEVGYDLSQVMFVLTANDAGAIPATLRDRLEIIQLSGYTEAEKTAIARGYLESRQRREHGLKEDQFAITDQAMSRAIDSYTREAGVRNLERTIAALCRKAARRIADDELQSVTVDAEDLDELLGPPEFVPEEDLHGDTIGLVNGLAVTPHGGEMLQVEAAWMEGKAAFVHTGNLGQVMKESARTALSYARSAAQDLGVQPNVFDRSRIHLHVPAGATPKDGPSAGIAMSTALVSALLGATVRGDIAMTGEVTLQGKVLAIGGLKEKILAAYRIGIREVIVPAANKADLDDIPTEIRTDMKFELVEHMDQVLARAIHPDDLRAHRAIPGRTVLA